MNKQENTNEPMKDYGWYLVGAITAAVLMSYVAVWIIEGLV